MENRQHSKHPRSQRGRRAAANAMAMAMYAKHVLRRQQGVRGGTAAAPAPRGSRMEALRGAVAAAKAATAGGQTGEQQTMTQQAGTASQTLVAIHERGVNVNVNIDVSVISVQAQALTGTGLGPLIMWPAAVPEVTARRWTPRRSSEPQV